jgi:hypothetical protein
MLTTDDGKELAYKHPWLYHVVWRSDERSRETVASDGLTHGQIRHRWHDLFKPRPGHVYLATHKYLSTAAWWLQRGGDDIYAVDTRHLVAARVSADEDHFTGINDAACDRFGLFRPPGMELWKTFGSEVVPSFGDWAEQVELGSDPAHVRLSVDNGSVAYRGVVPPKALRRWDGKDWQQDLLREVAS